MKRSGMPCVVQVGFAGPRKVFDSNLSDDKQALFVDKIQKHLGRCLEAAKEKFGLDDNHFFCGISQIAVGGDMIFAQVLEDRKSLHRVYLPQPLEEYLKATGSKGPDFEESERKAARTLIGSSNVAQVLVVADSQDRHDRFRQTNAEICRSSDLMICLVLKGADSGKAGGTRELARRTILSKKPCLVVEYEYNEEKMEFSDEWHNLDRAITPSLPSELEHLDLGQPSHRIPTIDEYCAPLKKMASEQSRAQRKFFQYAAAWVILAHIIATLCATFVVSYPKSYDSNEKAKIADTAEPNPTQAKKKQNEFKKRLVKSSFLIAELVLLLLGWWWHRMLHHSHTAVTWATARVVAELSRSIACVYPKHMYLQHLFRLSLPFRFRFLLRTLNVLHLNSTSRNVENWDEVRKGYLTNRIDDQISYYDNANAKDRKWLKLFNGLFLVCTATALLATLSKLLILLFAPDFGMDRSLGILAVLLPVLAVGGLSWASALDYQARVETYSESLEFLKRQKQMLATADTEAEFEKLIGETEAVLLGEVSNWFSRRANINVA